MRSISKKTVLRQTYLLHICVAGLVAMSCAPAVAQTGSGDPSDRELIKQLVKRIEVLEASQKELQRKLTENAVPAASPATQPPGALVENAAQPEPDSDSTTSHALGPIQFRGYSDVNYGRALFEKLPDGNRPGGGLRGSPN